MNIADKLREGFAPALQMLPSSVREQIKSGPQVRAPQSQAEFEQGFAALGIDFKVPPLFDGKRPLVSETELYALDVQMLMKVMNANPTSEQARAFVEQVTGEPCGIEALWLESAAWMVVFVEWLAAFSENPPPDFGQVKPKQARKWSGPVGQA